MNEAEYIKNRIDNQIQWHSEKSSTCQNKYKWITGIESVLILSIPVLSYLSDFGSFAKMCICAVSSMAAVLKFINWNNNYHELWVKYRLVAEALKKEKCLYQAGADIYKDNPDSFSILVETTENIIQNGNMKWEDIASSKKHYGSASTGS